MSDQNNSLEQFKKELEEDLKSFDESRPPKKETSSSTAKEHHSRPEEPPRSSSSSHSGSSNSSHKHSSSSSRSHITCENIVRRELMQIKNIFTRNPTAHHFDLA